ncbi:MAG TPA: hypothetical protein VH575_23400 [Gemmataceae bacterium]|jgi:DNA-binding MarR family transcriptional regulator
MAHWLFLPDDAMDDLATLAAIAPSNIEKLREFLDSSEYQIKVKSFVKVADLLGISDESAAKLCTFIDYVQRLREANGQDGAAVVSELRNFLKRNREDKESSGDAQRLLSYLDANEERLAKLFSELPSYVHSEKVRDLEQGPVPHLQSFRAYCDLRPVYDAQAEEIVSCFPIITLCIVTHSAESDDRQEVLIQLTEADLTEFRKQFVRLEKKLSKLKSRFPDLSIHRKGEVRR